MFKSSKNKGFSLVEMLVYISILVLMLGVVMGVTVSIVRSQRAVKASRDIESSVILSLERLSREIRLSDSVDINSSVFDSNPGRLVLESLDENENPRTVEFYILSGAIILRENGADVGALSQSDANVTSLIFRLFSDAEDVGIRTELEIESGTSTYYRSNNFYSSTVLR